VYEGEVGACKNELCIMKKTETKKNNEIKLINELIKTSEFKELQKIGKEIRDNQMKFDLLSVFEELINEMAWSKLFAYLLDSTKNHELGQSTFRAFLKKIPELKEFSKLFEQEKVTKIICETEWITEDSRRIDILIKLNDEKGKTKAVLGIENKVNSGEQHNQIKDYQKALNKKFHEIPRYIIYLTPDGRPAKTSDNNKDCPYIPVSYNAISEVCKELSKKTSGQGQLFLLILKNYIDKQTNKKDMDKKAHDLIKKLYADENHRQAIKLLIEYTPVKAVFEKVKEEILKSENLSFQKGGVEFYYHPKKSSPPNQFKIGIPELTGIGKKKGFKGGIYMLHCDNKSPNIGDKFTFRLVIRSDEEKFRSDEEKLRELGEKIHSSFKLPNSSEKNKLQGSWTYVEIGESYTLSDLGEEDVKGLTDFLIKRINDTYEDFKTGLINLEKNLTWKHKA